MFVKNCVPCLTLSAACRESLLPTQCSCSPPPPSLNYSDLYNISQTSLQLRTKMSTRNPYDVMSCYRNLPVDVIRSRVSLEHLIADGNFLNESAFNMPSFPRLKTLSIDYNEVSFAVMSPYVVGVSSRYYSRPILAVIVSIQNPYQRVHIRNSLVIQVHHPALLLENLRKSCPKLKSLSLIGNPAWISLLQGSRTLHKQFRSVLSHFPEKLSFVFMFTKNLNEQPECH